MSIRHIIGVLLSPVFLLGIAFWTALIWWEAARPWIAVLELGEKTCNWF